jgi:8-oxo-dGTP pyrophosphatase MutT (NUDIX family)
MRLNLGALTAGQPFCAAVVLVWHGLLALTLNDDHVPADQPRPVLRVGGVGGGQEPGETIWDCALREAHEEAGVAVDLVPAPVTRFFDHEARELVEVEHVEDELAPLLVERWERPNPDVPYKPGLPTGPYLYGASFLARAGDAAELRPGDVRALLFLPPELWSSLDGATVADVSAAGAELLERAPVPPQTRLWLHPYESFRLLVPMLDEPAVRAALDR